MKILVSEKLRGVEVKISKELVQAPQRKGSSRSQEDKGEVEARTHPEQEVRSTFCEQLSRGLAQRSVDGTAGQQKARQ